MISNFKLQDNKIFIKNRGEFYGNPYPFIYDIGNKLYEFAIMDPNDFEKVNTLYDEIINIVCTLKECDDKKNHDEYMDKLFNYRFKNYIILKSKNILKLNYPKIKNKKEELTKNIVIISI